MSMSHFRIEEAYNNSTYSQFEEEGIDQLSMILERIPQIQSFPFNYQEHLEKDKQAKVVLETVQFRKDRLLKCSLIDKSQHIYLQRCFTTYNYIEQNNNNIVVSSTTFFGNEKKHYVQISDKEQFTIGNLDQELDKQNEKHKLRLNEVYIREDQMSSLHLFVDYKWNHFHDGIQNDIGKLLQSISYKQLHPSYKTYNKVINYLQNWNNNKIKIKDVSVRGNSTQVEIRGQEDLDSTHNKLLSGTKFYLGQEVKITIRQNYEHFYQFILSQNSTKQYELYSEYLFNFISKYKVIIVGADEEFEDLVIKINSQQLNFQGFFKASSLLQLQSYFNKLVYFVKDNSENYLVFEGSQRFDLSKLTFKRIKPNDFVEIAEVEPNSTKEIKKYSSLTVLLHLESAPKHCYIKQVYDLLSQIRIKMFIGGLDESLHCLFLNVIDKTITFEQFQDTIQDEQNNNFHQALRTALGKSAILMYTEHDQKNQFQYFLLIGDQVKEFQMGRADGNYVTFYSSSISRNHGIIKYSNKLGWRIIDGQNNGQEHKRSTLGTWKVIDREEYYRIELNNDRKVKVGQTSLKFSKQEVGNYQQ